MDHAKAELNNPSISISISSHITHTHIHLNKKQKLARPFFFPLEGAFPLCLSLCRLFFVCLSTQRSPEGKVR